MSTPYNTTLNNALNDAIDADSPEDLRELLHGVHVQRPALCQLLQAATEQSHWQCIHYLLNELVELQDTQNESSLALNVYLAALREKNETLAIDVAKHINSALFQNPTYLESAMRNEYIKLFSAIEKNVDTPKMCTYLLDVLGRSKSGRTATQNAWKTVEQLLLTMPPASAIELAHHKLLVHRKIPFAEALRSKRDLQNNQNMLSDVSPAQTPVSKI